MNRKFGLLAIALVVALLLPAVSVQAQAEEGAASTSLEIHWLAVAMAIAAAGCGYGQSRVLTAACEGVSRNPGASDTIRFFFILGLAFIEFLALLTFVVVLLVIG
jgi:F-type H+-transporting ATPase subunit c